VYTLKKRQVEIINISYKGSKDTFSETILIKHKAETVKMRGKKNVLKAEYFP
jgi:hypothetical protein